MQLRIVITMRVKREQAESIHQIPKLEDIHGLFRKKMTIFVEKLIVIT